MALPSAFPVLPPSDFSRTGIIVGIVPGDPTFDIEIQRAPDSGGAPGTPVTIKQLPPTNVGGTTYNDFLPITGALYYYRYRHVRTGWTAGAYSPWTRAAIAKVLDWIVVSPRLPIPFDVALDPIPVVNEGSLSPAVIGDDATETFGPSGRADLAFNGDCELGLAYWSAADSVTGTADSITPPSVAAAFQIETASPYKGTKSLKWTAINANGVTVFQTLEPIDAIREARFLIFRVKEGDSFRIRAAAKSSIASKSLNLALLVFNASRTLTSAVAYTATLTTSFVEYEGVVTIPSGIFWACLALQSFAGEGTPTITVDDIHCWRQHTANDLAGTIAPPTIDGWYQDNVVASQTNVELTRAVGRWRATQAGSVTGVVATMTEARTAGTLTVTVFKNTGLAGAAGSSIGLTAVIDGTNTSRKATTQAKDLDTFAAGDELYIVVTTDGSWTPTTSDLRAALEVEI